MSSGMAAKSLIQSVREITLPLSRNKTDQTGLNKARTNLSKIVGRNVDNLKEKEILRAAAESASENYVDGVFSPLFWMFTGACLWQFSTSLPGPLALVWMFKASSTLDSMIGYKKGNLKWLGTTGAKLDDLLVWIPCRLVLISLPLISQPINNFTKLVSNAVNEGRHDPSPNSGISEAIFAHCAKVKMGGENNYGNIKINKPILAGDAMDANPKSINNILNLGIRLQFTWLSFIGLIALLS